MLILLSSVKFEIISQSDQEIQDFNYFNEEIFEEYKNTKYISSPLLVSGRDLIDLGYDEGPEIGRALQLINEKYEEGYLATYNQALDYAEDILL